MKKNLLFILVCSLLSNASLVYSQNPVPNPGFENWTGGNPDGWTTTNAIGFAVPITQTTPPYNGALALKGEVVSSVAGNYPPVLYSIDGNGSGFPVSQQYGTFSFYYKFNPIGPVVFNAIALISDASGSGVGAGSIQITSLATSFTLASTPIYYVPGIPDTAYITFTLSDTSGGTPALGNYFIIDDVTLSGFTGIEEHLPLTLSIEKIQPNPANNVSFIYYSLPSNGDLTFSLYDITGKKYKEFLLLNETAGRHKVELNVSDVPAGFYILQMSSPDGIRATPVQVVR